MRGKKLDHALARLTHKSSLAINYSSQVEQSLEKAIAFAASNKFLAEERIATSVILTLALGLDVQQIAEFRA